MGTLVERSTGDVIPADDQNFVKDYIEDAVERVNTASLSIGGTEIIDSNGDISHAQTATTGYALNISRNLSSASTDSPVVRFLQDNATDDQPTLQLQNDGTRGAINLVGVTSDPSSPSEGDVWYNTTDNKLRFYDGTTTQDLPGGTASGTSVKLTSQTIEGTVATGDLVFYNGNTSQWEKTNVNTTPFGLVSGSSEVTLFGEVTGLSGLTAGALYFQDTTNGEDYTTADTSQIKIGIATSTTSLLLDIDTEGSNVSAVGQTVSSDPSLGSNLVAYWDSDTDGTFTDNTGNGHTGTINGATFTSSGQVGGAYDYDGTNDYVEVADSSSFTFSSGGGNDDPFSISLWVNFDTSAANAMLISKMNRNTADEEWVLFKDSGENIKFRISTDNNNFQEIETTSTVSTGSWIHIVVTYDGGNDLSTGLTIYIDNSSQTLTGFSETGTYTGMSDTAQPVMIGTWDNGGTPGLFLNGRLDEIGVWSKELTSGDVSNLYNGGAGLPYD